MDVETYADVLPWLVFLVIDRKTGLGVSWAAGSGALTAGGLRLWAYWNGRHAPAATIALAIFVPCYAAAMAFPSWDMSVFPPRAVVVFALCLVLFASLRVRPLSATYFRGQVAPGAVSQPEFRRVNLEITAAWGAGAFLVSASFAGAAADPQPMVVTILNWVLPLVFATGTVLWVARRWERFRLGLEAARSSVGPPVTQLRDLESLAEDEAVVYRLPARGHGRT